jgi:hypothetical protein
MIASAIWCDVSRVKEAAYWLSTVSTSVSELGAEFFF